MRRIFGGISAAFGPLSCRRKSSCSRGLWRAWLFGGAALFRGHRRHKPHHQKKNGRRQLEIRSHVHLMYRRTHSPNWRGSSGFCSSQKLPVSPGQCPQEELR
jgi:hypothetical protein